MASSNKVWVDFVDPKCEAVDLNGFQNENNNFITSSNQSLNTSDNLQTSKAVSVYASKGDFYQETGGSAANIYVLENNDLLQPIFELRDGMRIRFRVTNTNTGASTINVNSLGIKDIKTLDGFDPAGNQILAGDVAEIVYDGTDFILNNPRIVNQTKLLSSIVTSSGVMADLTYTLTAGATYRITGQLGVEVNTGGTDTTVSVALKDGANFIGKLRLEDVSNNQVTVYGFSYIYEMVGTSLTFEAISASANSVIRGDNTRGETFAQVERLPNSIVGTVV